MNSSFVKQNQSNINQQHVLILFDWYWIFVFYDNLLLFIIIFVSCGSSGY